jgi:hypothetical protein
LIKLVGLATAVSLFLFVLINLLART